MELSFDIPQRILLVSLLPQRGGYKTMKGARWIGEHLEVDDAEREEKGVVITNVGEGVINLKVETPGDPLVLTDIPDLAIACLKDIFVKLDESEEIPPGLIDMYEAVVMIEEETERIAGEEVAPEEPAVTEG